MARADRGRGCSGRWRRGLRSGSTRCSARRSPRRWRCWRCRQAWEWRCGWRRWGGPVARGLILVGRNTLPIYVLHPLVMRVFFLAFQRPEPLPRAAWVLLVDGGSGWWCPMLLGRRWGGSPACSGCRRCRRAWPRQGARGSRRGIPPERPTPPACVPRLHGGLAHSRAGGAGPPLPFAPRRTPKGSNPPGHTPCGTQALGFAIAATHSAW